MAMYMYMYMYTYVDVYVYVAYPSLPAPEQQPQGWAGGGDIGRYRTRGVPGERQDGEN